MIISNLFIGISVDRKSYMCVFRQGEHPKISKIDSIDDFRDRVKVYASENRPLFFIEKVKTDEKNVIDKYMDIRRELEKMCIPFVLVSTYKYLDFFDSVFCRADMPQSKRLKAIISLNFPVLSAIPFSQIWAVGVMLFGFLMARDSEHWILNNVPKYMHPAIYEDENLF